MPDSGNQIDHLPAPGVGRGDSGARARLEAVDTVLKVLCRTTGLRVAFVVRVEDECWSAFAVHDEIGFGVKSGDRIRLSHTY